ncbi:prepilin peptidase [Nocardia sp. NPDC020380]|uniref:prepilin peptidase n=1 Tax=Nocardia sp. NPDC020380 TaxID=3364309 RepID=UPI0037A15C6F
MNLPAILLLTVWGAVLSGFDLRWQRLPNALTLPGAGAILIGAAATGRFATAAAGGLLLATPYLLVHVCAPEALGAGDVKLALGLGAATALSGPQTWVWAALAAPLLTAIAGIGRTLTENSVLSSGIHPAVRPLEPTGLRARGGRLPHGPAMCVASVVALLAAQ